MPAHYDDPNFSYVKYWQGRDYEHQSEMLAIKKLLADQKFSFSADIGGGYGRLTSYLGQISKKAVLVEPSKKQLEIAKKLLSPQKNISLIQGTSEKTKLDSASVDLATIIRVSHHLPELKNTLSELARVIKPDGLLIFEIANSTNFKARINSWLTATPIHTIPVEKRSLGNIRKKTIAFVNHHPQVVEKNLTLAGFSIQKRLSVSNLRSPLLKRILPLKLIVLIESLLQEPLGHLYFGPSIFVLAKRNQAIDTIKAP